MAVRDEDIKGAVVVIVDEAGAEAHVERARLPQSGLVDRVRERAVSVVAIERVRLVRQVRHEDVEQAVTVVVACVHAHARLGHAVEAVRAPGKQPGLYERAVPAVEKQVVRRVVVRDVQVGGAVIVQVRCHDAEPLPSEQPLDPADPGRAAYVLECAVPVVSVQAVGRPLEQRRVAVRRQVGFAARRVLGVE